MRRWVGSVVAVAVAVTVALGVGWVRSDRQDAMVRDWAGPDDVVSLRGSEFQFVGLEAVEHEPRGSSDPIPDGAAVVVAQIRQDVVEAPEDEFALTCTISLESRPHKWLPDSDVMIDRELASRCHSDGDGPVTTGQSRVIEVAWVVPASAVAEARVVVRFGGDTAEAIGFAPGS